MCAVDTIRVSMDAFREGVTPYVVLSDYRKVKDDGFEPRLVESRRREVLGMLLL